MPLTLSPPLVPADAGGDAAVVAGMASAIPAASAPVTSDLMVSPGITSTAHDRGAAHPSSPRKHWPGYWPAGRVDPGPRRATTWRCAHRVASRNCGPTCATRAYHMQKALSLRETASERRGRVLAAAPAHHFYSGRTGTVHQPIVRGWMSPYGRFCRSAPYPLLGRINH